MGNLTHTVGGSSNLVSFRSAARVPIDSLKVYFNPVQAGTGDPSPENIRPITGWTSADIYEAGKNLWGGTQLRDDILAKVEGATADNTAKTVTYAASKVRNVVLFTGFKANTRYTIFLSGDNTSSTIKSPNLTVHYSDGTMESIGSFVDGVKIHTTHSSKSVVDIQGVWNTSTTILNYEKCGVFEGVLTENDFVPSEGKKIPITFPVEAGTIYGGYIDPARGVARAEWGVVDLGSLTWSIYQNTQSGLSFFYAPLSNCAENVQGGREAYCASYKRYDPRGGNWWTNMPDKQFVSQASGVSSAARVWIRDDAYSDKSTFKTSMSGVKLVYQLATPVEYPITPTSLKTLLDQNHVWSNTNGNTEVTYKLHDSLMIREAKKRVVSNWPDLLTVEELGSCVTG